MEQAMASRGTEQLDDFEQQGAQVRTREEELIDEETQRNRRRALHESISQLTDRERDVILSRAYLAKPLTLQEIGSKLGISTERARQIELQATRKLRTLMDKRLNKLAKRTPGKPLSEAEHRQRVEAAKSRWADRAVTGLGVAAGAGMGAAIADVGGDHMLARTTGKLRDAVRGFRSSIAGADDYFGGQLAHLKTLSQRATRSLGNSNSVGPNIDVANAPFSKVVERSSKSGWPVPQWYRHLKRIMPKEALKGFEFKPGQKIDGSIQDVLANFGFKQSAAQAVDQIGPQEFMIRGDTAFIKPSVGAAFKVSLFDDAVDEIRDFANKKLVSARVGGPGEWADYAKDLKPPFMGARSSTTATRHKASWSQPMPEPREAALRRAMRPNERQLFFELNQRYLGRGSMLNLSPEEAALPGDTAENFLKAIRGGKIPRVRLRTADRPMKGDVGKTFGRRATNVRYQGTPKDVDLERMRIELGEAFAVRANRIQNTLTAGYKDAVDSAKSRWKPTIDQTKRNLAPWMRQNRGKLVVAGSLAGAGVAYLALRALRGRNEDVEKLAKADTSSESYIVQLARAIARTLGLWRENPDKIEPSDLQTATERVNEAFLAGAEAQNQVSSVQAQGRPSILAWFFGARNPAVLDAAERHQLRLIKDLSETQRQSVQQAITNQAIRGESPDTVARAIRESIGLTPTQAKHVAAYRMELELLHPTALSRQLRDRRFDASIKKAMETKQKLPVDRIDRMVDAYQRRYIAYRATTIARTEVVKAANMGALESTRQQLTAMPDMTVMKTWLATSDEKTRPNHQYLNGKTVLGLDTPFILPDGTTIRWPHDEMAPASECINCRCTFTLKLVPRSSAPQQFMAEAV
jgi:DNA-binding CsgD family transcriptional regulator